MKIKLLEQKLNINIFLLFDFVVNTGESRYNPDMGPPAASCNGKQYRDALHRGLSVCASTWWKNFTAKNVKRNLLPHSFNSHSKQPDRGVTECTPCLHLDTPNAETFKSQLYKKFFRENLLQTISLVVIARLNRKSAALD